MTGQETLLGKCAASYIFKNLQENKDILQSSWIISKLNYPSNLLKGHAYNMQQNSTLATLKLFSIYENNKSVLKVQPLEKKNWGK